MKNMCIIQPLEFYHHRHHHNHQHHQHHHVLLLLSIITGIDIFDIFLKYSFSEMSIIFRIRTYEDGCDSGMN